MPPGWLPPLHSVLFIPSVSSNDAEGMKEIRRSANASRSALRTR